MNSGVSPQRYYPSHKLILSNRYAGIAIKNKGKELSNYSKYIIE